MLFYQIIRDIQSTCNSNDMSKLYRSLCIPKLCYGLDICVNSDKSLELMNSFHYNMAKHFQLLPSSACNIGSLQTIGWIFIEAELACSSLMFLLRIFKLPMSNIYKIICNRYSPIQRRIVVNILRKNESRQARVLRRIFTTFLR